MNSNTRRNAWTIQKIGGEPFLYRAYMRNGRIVAAYISAEHFFTGSMDPAISNMSLVLTDEAGMAWQIVGNGLAGAEIGQAIPEQGHNWKVNQCRIGDSSLYMTGYLNESGMEFTTKNSVLALILIALVAVCFAYPLKMTVRGIRGKFLRSSRPEKSHNNPKMASTWGCGAFGLCCV